MGGENSPSAATRDREASMRMGGGVCTPLAVRFCWNCGLVTHSCRLCSSVMEPSGCKGPTSKHEALAPLLTCKPEMEVAYGL